MPQAPDVSLFTRYVLENPRTLAIILLVIAAFLAWTGFREGIESRQKAMIVPFALALLVLAIGHFTVTPGERARVITQELIAATISKDLVVTDQLLTDNAVVSFGSPNNPPFDREYIMRRLDAFRNRFTIDSNSISSMKAYGESPNAAIVHLDCFSQVTTDQYTVPARSQWVLCVERTSSGDWKISKVTCISVNNQSQNGEF